MTKLFLIFIFMINIYADENKKTNDKFQTIEEKILQIEKENILLKHNNTILIEKIQSLDTHNKYIETTYTTIINNNQNRLDNFLWTLASIIALLGFIGYTTIQRYISIKINKIINVKQNELDTLIENVKDLEKGLKFEYLQKLAEFSQHNKKSGEITKAEKDWLTYYSELLPINEEELTFEDWKILAFKYFYVDKDFANSIRSIEKSIQLNPNFDFGDNKLLMYSYEAMEEYEKAIKQCLDILEKVEDDEIYFSLANYYMILDYPIDAIETYLKIKSNEYNLDFFIAKAYSLSGNYNKAIDYLNKCEDKETNVDILYGLSECYNNLENKNEAVKFIKKALEIEPDNIEFQEFLYFLTSSDTTKHSSQ